MNGLVICFNIVRLLSIVLAIYLSFIRMISLFTRK